MQRAQNRVSQAQTRAHINPHSVAATPRILHCRGRKTRARHAQNRPRPAPKSVAATPRILDCRTRKSFASDSEKRARFWSRKTSSVSGRAWRAHNTFPLENVIGAPHHGSRLASSEISLGNAPRGVGFSAPGTAANRARLVGISEPTKRISLGCATPKVRGRG